MHRIPAPSKCIRVPALSGPCPSKVKKSGILWENPRKQLEFCDIYGKNPWNFVIILYLWEGQGRVERGSFTLTLSQNRAWKSPLTRLFTLNSLYIDIILVSDLSANDRIDCGLCSLSLAAKCLGEIIFIDKPKGLILGIRIPYTLYDSKYCPSAPLE